MKILILTSVYPPLGNSGHDERCRQTVRCLAKRGHHLQVLTSDHRLPPVGVPGEKGVYRELRLYSELSEDPLLGHSFRATYLHERANAGSLQYRLRRFKPDTVYVWNMQGLSKSLLFQIQSRGIRLVCDLHADWLLPENFNLDPWYRWWFENQSKRSLLYRTLIRGGGRARRVLAMLPIGESSELNLEGSYIVSGWLRERLAGAGVPQVEASLLIYPATDLKKLSPKTWYKNRRRFIWAGRLDEVKGCDLAVDAVSLLKERGIEVSLDLFALGEPKERKAQRVRIEAAGLIDQVTMRGIRPGELAEHYARYDALLYTNRRGEPFSMTVLEAMLSKLPCIVADTGGNMELLQDGTNALFFKAGDTHSLADAIARFMSLDDGGRALAEHSIERLHRERSAETFCEEIEPLLSANR